MGAGLSLAVSIGIPLAGGIVGGITSAKDIRGWYRQLKKPKWNPPDVLFGIMWPLLYTSQGVASWLVFRQNGVNRVLPLSLYGAQLVLNWIWQPLFFKAHKLRLATADAAAMVGVATIATVAMSQATSPAKVVPLMAPYLAWITFATALSYNIWKNNPEAEKIDSDGNPKKIE